MPHLSMTTYLMKRSLRETRISIWATAVLIFMMFNVSQASAQKTTSADSSTAITTASDTKRTLFGGKITNSGY